MVYLWNSGWRCMLVNNHKHGMWFSSPWNNSPSLRRIFCIIHTQIQFSITLIRSCGFEITNSWGVWILWGKPLLNVSTRPTFQHRSILVLREKRFSEMFSKKRRKSIFRETIRWKSSYIETIIYGKNCLMFNCTRGSREKIHKLYWIHSVRRSFIVSSSESALNWNKSKKFSG